MNEITVGRIRVDLDHMIVELDGKDVGLTRREFDVVAYLANRANTFPSVRKSFYTRSSRTRSRPTRSRSASASSVSSSTTRTTSSLGRATASATC